VRAHLFVGLEVVQPFDELRLEWLCLSDRLAAAFGVATGRAEVAANAGARSSEQAAARAKEGVEDVQAKRELSQTYNDLGKTAYELIESGEIVHARLETGAAKIRALNLSAADGAATTNGAAEAHDPGQPPAMPT
jgi:hypothetical protein